jgi:hypothetical protein
MSYTPAPWHGYQPRNAYGETTDSYWLIQAGNGVQVADLFGLTGKQDEDTGQDLFISNEESAANARLIAAAPDLLAACEALLAVVEEYSDFQSEIEMPAEFIAATRQLREAVAACNRSG